MADTIGS